MRQFAGLVDEAVRTVRGAGFGAVRELFWRTYFRYGRHLDPDPVLDSDWDLLVVLDACRSDLWQEVVEESDELPTGTTRISPGGTSTEWLDAVFDSAAPAQLSDLGYVTANPYSDSHVDEDRLGALAEVWRYAWDDDIGTTPPRPVTDAAVRLGRERDLDRLVVHYMQPHFPSLGDDRDDGIELDSFGEESLSVWEDLRFGNRSKAAVWEAYRENLEIVIEDVRLLLSNCAADTAVVTADHGNAVGEYGIYGHAAGIALRPLRQVPWVVTSGSDTGSHEPATRPQTDATPVASSEETVRQRLEDLGYRT